MSLKFLNKKTWHTAGQLTQRRVYEAQANLAAKQKAEAQREQELRKELEYEQTRKLLASHKNAWEEDADDMRKKGGQLSFLYEAPPGLTGPVGEAAENFEEKKAKDMTASERFPEFKGAPVANAAGKTVEEVEKHQAIDPRAIKPLGLEVRNVRCVKCKKWGHQMGDPECPMRALSVDTEKFRQQIEDPLMLFDGSSGAAVTDRLVLRQAIDGTHGGKAVNDTNLDILLSDDDEPAAPRSKDLRKAAKLRLKELKKQLKSKKKKKKHKKHKKQSDSDSSSSSSSDSEDEPAKGHTKSSRKDSDRPRQEIDSKEERVVISNAAGGALARDCQQEKAREDRDGREDRERGREDREGGRREGGREEVSRKRHTENGERPRYYDRRDPGEDRERGGRQRSRSRERSRERDRDRERRRETRK